jgi:exodeoxyribonuclease V gamma subunit
MGQLVRELLGPTSPEPREIDLTLDGGVRVLGWLRAVGTKGQILYRYSFARGKHELDAWIRHLAMIASGAGRDTFMIAKRKDGGPVIEKFTPVKRPHEHLADLVALYRLGQRVPLPLFPDPASAYVSKLVEGKTTEQALDAARKSYHTGYDGSANAYVAKVYGGDDPIDPAYRLFSSAPGEEFPPSFVEVAVRVFRPLFEHLEEMEVSS